MIQIFKCALLQKQIPHYAHLQGEFFYILQSNSSILSTYNSYVYPRWKLNLYCHQSPKRGRLQVHLVPPLVGFGVLTTNLVEGLMCLWELKDNTGRSPSLIRFSYKRWPLKMYEDTEVKGGMWRHSHWRLWQEKTSHEAYGARRLRSFVVLFLLCWVIGTTVLLSGVQVNQSEWLKWCLNQKPMSSSEDYESESCPESDKSALLVAQVKLSCDFEIWPLEHVSVP